MWWQLYPRCEYTWQRAGSWPRNNCSLCCILEPAASPRAVGGALEGVPGGRGTQLYAEPTFRLYQLLAYLPVSALYLARSLQPGKALVPTSRTISPPRENAKVSLEPCAGGPPTVVMEAGCLVQGTGAVQSAAQVSVSVSAWVALLLCS